MLLKLNFMEADKIVKTARIVYLKFPKCSVYQFPVVAVTNYHTLAILKQQFSDSFEGHKTEIITIAWCMSL